ncbi:MAG TPA: serine/threonine-protein kinase, partial [Kofleriaceae bacterium]|nr:serine/threonine-protein kinase [Kofleriaceae bacterium]
DIKPGNIMLCRHGGAFDVVKVLDFGLVKDVASGDQAALTHADAMVGTPLYLSPEAITGPSRVSARSDLYAVGGVGYFLLAGRPVFDGETVAEVCARHLYEPPVPPSTFESVPADLEALVLACLDKSPERRPADARALREALLACATAGDWTPAEARRWWQSHGAPVPEELAVAPTLPGHRVPAQPA